MIEVYPIRRRESNERGTELTRRRCAII